VFQFSLIFEEISGMRSHGRSELEWICHRCLKCRDYLLWNEKW